jgi:acyl carrier protein
MFEKLKVVIAEVLSVKDIDSITQKSLIIEDLGADSLDVVDLMNAIEDNFEVKIPDEAIEHIKTVEDILNHLKENAVEE